MYIQGAGRYVKKKYIYHVNRSRITYNKAYKQHGNNKKDWDFTFSFFFSLVKSYFANFFQNSNLLLHHFHYFAPLYCTLDLLLCYFHSTLERLPASFSVLRCCGFNGLFYARDPVYGLSRHDAIRRRENFYAYLNSRSGSFRNY